MAHPHVSPSIIADVAPLPITVAARHQLPVIVSRPSTAGKRQPKSSVPIGVNEPSLGSVREESQSGVTGSTSIGIESQPYSVADVAEPRPMSIDAGQPRSRGVVRPSPTHVRPTPTSTSAGSMPAHHVVYPPNVGAHVMSRPTLADDESTMRQPTSAYTGQYAAVCTGLQVQTSAETLTAQSLLLLGRCPTSPHSSQSSVHDWLQATGTRAPPASPVQSVSSSSSELQQVLAPRTEAPVVVPPSVRSSRASRMSRTSRRSVASSLAIKIFGFAREMSGQTTQLVGQMQAHAQVYQDQSQNQMNLILAQAEAHKQEARQR